MNTQPVARPLDATVKAYEVSSNGPVEPFDPETMVTLLEYLVDVAPMPISF